MTQIQVSNADLRRIQSTVVERMSGLAGRKILIIGDIGLDEYVTGDVRRISPEAPVPVVEVATQESRLGLAANVAQNVASLGGEAVLLSVLGEDAAGQTIQKMLEKAGVSTEHLLTDGSRPTTRKLRVMTGHHHIVRVDFELKEFLNAQVEAEFRNRWQKLLANVDGVIVQDYAKGVVSESLMKQIIPVAHRMGKRVVVDPYPSTPAQYYSGADLMTPNRDEAMKLAACDFDSLRTKPDYILEVGQRLMSQLGLKQLVITRGKEGMSLFYPDRVVHLPTYARQVFDVTGAGDTVVASLSLALAAGWNLEEACVLANFAAGVVVAKVGCVPCTQAELLQYIQSHPIA